MKFKFGKLKVLVLMLIKVDVFGFFSTTIYSPIDMFDCFTFPTCLIFLSTKQENLCDKSSTNIPTVKSGRIVLSC